MWLVTQPQPEQVKQVSGELGELIKDGNNTAVCLYTRATNKLASFEHRALTIDSLLLEQGSHVAALCQLKCQTKTPVLIHCVLPIVNTVVWPSPRGRWVSLAAPVSWLTFLLSEFLPQLTDSTAPPDVTAGLSRCLHGRLVKCTITITSIAHLI